MAEVGIEWVGTDGSRWDIRRGLVRISTEGVEGFAEPDLTWQTQQLAGVHGRRTTGYLFDHREVWLPLRFKGAAERDVEGVQRQWWKACRPGGVGRLEVFDALGERRSLDVHVTDNGKPKFSIDPHVTHPPFGMALSVDDPMWRGDEVLREFSLAGGNGESFYGGGVPGATYSYETRPGGSTVYSREVNPKAGTTRFNWLGRGARLRRVEDFTPSGWAGATGTQSLADTENGKGIKRQATLAQAAGAVLERAPIANGPGLSQWGAALRVRNDTNAVMRVRLGIGTIPTSGSPTWGTLGDIVTIPVGEHRRVTVLGPSNSSSAPSVGLVTVDALPSNATYMMSDSIVEQDSAPGPAFDGDSGAAPLFYLLPASATDGTTVTNSGDEPVWPVLEFSGPIEAFEVSIGGRVTSGTFNIARGSLLVIDTEAQTVELDGVNVLRNMTMLDFAPVPVGGQVDIGLKVTGSGLARVRFSPGYLRAW